ncbi:SEC14-like protein 2 [Orchesella cincta]|uniref:SEC14-like protein 2 n=1 Tax=Orchesella cincta TaxID=48709 RepID=A0A1D2MNN9_ORCCI|nr:SEC14-like protein 2 [Orchesella cincta]
MAIKRRTTNTGKILSLLLFMPAWIFAYSNHLFSNIDGSKLQINQLPEVLERDGRTEKLSIFELVILGQLQNFVEDEMGIERFSDPFWAGTSFLTNLLDSSRWNIKTAKRKLRKAIRQRRASDSNAIANKNETLSDLSQSFNFEIKGLDKESCPIIILPIGEWRTYRSFIEKTKSLPLAHKRLKLYFHNLMERGLEPLRNRNDSECSQITLIADMDGYIHIHSSGVKIFLDFIRQFHISYPGVLKIAYIINSTPDFLNVAQAVKTRVPWDLRTKSFIYTDKSFWQEALLQNIASSQLAPEYGGTNFFLG